MVWGFPFYSASYRTHTSGGAGLNHHGHYVGFSVLPKDIWPGGGRELNHQSQDWATATLSLTLQYCPSTGKC